MRMRLRAPDEPEAETSYEGDGGNTSAPSTPEQSHFLPPLDVGSPEYIEERLENLKRRPTWGDFLDQYVQEHMDSDSEGETGDAAEVYTSGFIPSTLWSLLVVAVAPLLVFCAPCLRHKGYGFWPLGCRSLKELFGCAVTNVMYMIFGLLLLYWTICRELPDVFHASNTLIKLNVQIDEMIHAADTCHAALLQWERAVVQELCMPVGIDIALLLVNTYLLLHCHRRWSRYLMVFLAIMFVVDMPAKLYDATFPTPMIYNVDPNFALVDEELIVALDGKNLKHGGSVAWVAYWGCAVTANVDACDKQFVSTFEAGNVAVTFKSLDHFIPCYRDPPNPLKAQDYTCFENVRIRVKVKQSIPGWSRYLTQASSVSQSALSVPSLSDDRQDSLGMPPFKLEKKLLPFRIDQDSIEPTSSERKLATLAESMEADTSTSISEHLTAKHDGLSRLEKASVELSGTEGSQENESLSWSSQGNEMEHDTLEVADVPSERVAEVVVAPYAEVEAYHADIRPNVVLIDDAVLPAETPRRTSHTEEVGLDKPHIQMEVTSADNAEEPTISTTKGSEFAPTSDVQVIDEDILPTAIAEVLETEATSMQVVSTISEEERGILVEVKRDAETNANAALLDEARSRATSTQQEMSHSTTARSKTSPSRPVDAANYRTREGRRKKESGPNIDGNAAFAE